MAVPLGQARGTVGLPVHGTREVQGLAAGLGGQLGAAQQHTRSRLIWTLYRTTAHCGVRARIAVKLTK